MPKNPTMPLYLRRIDPDRNMARFYVLTVQPTLFGGASLIRHWGRIATRGQSMVETYDDQQQVQDAFGRLERMKRKKGYTNADAADTEIIQL